MSKRNVDELKKTYNDIEKGNIDLFKLGQLYGMARCMYFGNSIKWDDVLSAINEHEYKKLLELLKPVIRLYS
jgi:hypothetical protein